MYLNGRHSKSTDPMLLTHRLLSEVAEARSSADPMINPISAGARCPIHELTFTNAMCFLRKSDYFVVDLKMGEGRSHLPADAR
jgi:hypothetical protein